MSTLVLDLKIEVQRVLWSIWSIWTNLDTGLVCIELRSIGAATKMFQDTYIFPILSFFRVNSFQKLWMYMYVHILRVRIASKKKPVLSHQYSRCIQAWKVLEFWLGPGKGHTKRNWPWGPTNGAWICLKSGHLPWILVLEFWTDELSKTRIKPWQKKFEEKLADLKNN